MGNLERIWTFTAAERAIVSVTGQADVALNGLPPCDSVVSVLTGCGNTVLSILSNFVNGTITGAPDTLNLVLSVYINVLLAVAIVKLVRGVNDV